MVAAALIDRLVHHATMITLKGKSYRLRERGAGIAPAAQAPSLRDSDERRNHPTDWCTSRRPKVVHYFAAP
jgi:IstB-like ATP binding protein